MKTSTRNAIAIGGALAAMAAGLMWAAQHRMLPDLRARSLDSIPNGALLVATADLDALRASPAWGPLLRQGREIPGLGKVSEVCGFDPMDTLHELAVAIPAAGDEGEFGVVASGDVQEEALIACASKVIEARGGRAVETMIGSFRTVRDATLAATGGEIAVRKGGPVLLGAGAYLRAMIDAADGRAPTIRSSVAHTYLAREVGQAALRVTVVLTPEQRKMLDAELQSRSGSGRGDPPTSMGMDGGSTADPRGGREDPRVIPGRAVIAGALGVDLGQAVSFHAVLLCEGEPACRNIAASLQSARDARASDLATRLVGLGAVLARVQIEAEGEQIHARVGIPSDEAVKLVERIIALRGMSHPMPRDPGASPPSAMAPPRERPLLPGAQGADAGRASSLDEPDEIIKAEPKDADTGAAPR